MEVQKEAFSNLIEYYKLLPIELKRKEVVSELEELIEHYSIICTKLGVVPDMILNKEILNLNRNNLNEEDFLTALYAYLNTLQDISAQFIETISSKIQYM